MVDRFEELRTYIAVVETGGVNAAAAKLGIARSAVSRRLSELETRLSATLVERSTRRFELTATGQRYYAEAKRILEDLARIDASTARDDVQGSTIVVDAPPGLVATVAGALAAFLAAHPENTLRIVHQAKREKPSLTISTTGQEGARRVGDLHPVVVCAPSYFEGRPPPDDLADLDGHVAIVVDGPAGAWTSRVGAKVTPRAAATVDDDAAALALAIAGAGLARLPRALCASAIAAGRLVEVLATKRPGPQPVHALASDGSAVGAALLDHLAAYASGD